VEFSGDVSGMAVANGPNSGGRQGLRRTAAGGGEGLWDVKIAYHNIALSKALTAQTILRPEGRPDIVLHNWINLSYRTQ
jgi:hypothetical protein